MLERSSRLRFAAGGGCRGRGRHVGGVVKAIYSRGGRPDLRGAAALHDQEREARWMDRRSSIAILVKLMKGKRREQGGKMGLVILTGCA